MRRLHQWLLAVGVATLAALALAPASGACVLAGPLPSPDARVQMADVAFTGTVVASAVAQDGADGPVSGTRMTVAVDRVLKGQVPATVELIAGMTSCAAPFAAGTRVGLAMSPTTPTPWAANVYDDVGAAALDALPLDGAFAARRVTKLAAKPGRRAVQVRFTARACTTVRATLAQTASTLSASLTSADGPACTSGKVVDRCVTLVAEKALGARALRPAAAARVAPVAATRCPKLAS
jgi:hypothetical protein